MKHLLRTLAASLCLCTTNAFAEMVEVPTAGGDGDKLEFEVDLEGSYVGGGDIEREEFRIQDMDEWNFLARFLVLPETPIGILRLGAEYEIYDFDMPEFQLPDRLQSAALIVGLDTKFSDELLVRFEAKPGLYSGDELEGGDYNAPMILGGTYLYSSSLQFVFGVGIDWESDYFVLPGGGVRWKFHPQWVANMTLPTPRLEYEVNNNLMLYVGADIRGKTYRVDDDLVSLPGDDGNVNNGVLRYSELRTGGGLQWRFGEGSKLSLEGGYMPHREFDYHRTDVRWHHEAGAPYGSVSFHLAF
ncbi:MAG TPA: DUF6268 family outer membrane beta-barrel protein [Chthoniobacterales bacterium]|nr:DUF6268 family outer membrane beta-barrel protein [Chthoniobacterales bacterium]